MSKKTDLANSLQKWAETMGYKFGPNSPSQESFERLCGTPQMVGIVKHLIEHLRPADEVRLLKKYCLLQKLKDEKKSNKPMITEKHLERLRNETRDTVDITAKEIQELKEMISKQKGMSDAVGRANERGMVELHKEKERVRKDAECIQKIDEDLKILLEASKLPSPNPNPEFDQERAKMELDKCEETAREHDALVGDIVSPRAGKAAELRDAIETASLVVPAQALFKELFDRMESALRELKELKIRINDDCGFGSNLTGDLFYETHRMHVQSAIKANKEKEKFYSLSKELKETYARTLELWCKSLEDDSVIMEEVEQDERNVKEVVDKWLKSEVRGIVSVARVKKYNELVTKLDAATNRIDCSAAKNAPSQKEMDALIKEKVNSIGQYASVGHGELAAAVGKAMCDIGNSVRSIGAIVATSSADTQETSHGTLRGANLSTIACEPSINNISVYSDSGYSGFCHSSFQYLNLSGKDQNRAGGKIKHDTDRVRTRLSDDITTYPPMNTTWHSELSTVVDRIDKFCKLGGNNSVPLFNIRNIKTVCDFPRIEKLDERESKNRESTNRRRDCLLKYNDGLYTELERINSVLNFWMEQPFNECLTEIKVEGKTYETLRNNMKTAVKKIRSAREVRQKMDDIK